MPYIDMAVHIGLDTIQICCPFLNMIQIWRNFSCLQDPKFCRFLSYVFIQYWDDLVKSIHVWTDKYMPNSSTTSYIMVSEILLVWVKTWLSFERRRLHIYFESLFLSLIFGNVTAYNACPLSLGKLQPKVSLYSYGTPRA